MRAVVSGWTGRKLNDSNMTAAGEMYAEEVLELFNMNNTLSEFNSPTYAGITIYALTLWAKYMPSDSVMNQEGQRVLGEVWDLLAMMYNSNLRNLAGPWDRTYGDQILISRQAYAPPYDLEPRNITTWVSPNLTIGGESFNQGNLGGAREDRSAWSPGVVQWKRRDNSVGWFNVWPSETAMNIDVAPNSINFTYPNGNASSTFSFIVALNPLSGKRDITSVRDLDGLDLEVSGTVDVDSPSISFCGLVGGTCKIIHGFEFWNVTWSMPTNSIQIPSINFKVNLL
ncbi:hypothetical protein SNOG_14095 [Parastagonospora nodorum SN15]|uniref:Uncharacterized protein n=1 Tax=Phaeosphaeria nodorum (strain SN15 / ATCC MYA-4574 / FGSC 10173) TaxID=321614 RepID=Q0U2D8_PHANO|nr:hypothetical protein SNOG_14095 [Parastagonospora nodorum SN15]EAT78720.2 hypothetical protein SNOG_14095 [Parastagonospora nodorum SN15]